MSRILVIGAGGREHALAWAMARCPGVEQVLVAPGNDGIAAMAGEGVVCVPARALDAVRSLARERAVSLVVIGPEAPLVAGWADALRADGLAVFGPGAAAAHIEGDKRWAKELMDEAGVPTARAEAFTDLDAALRAVRALDGDCVVKATGLAAGKGVFVCRDRERAEAAVRDCLEGAAFGEAGRTVLVEERLEGPELSVFAVTDGRRLAWFAPSRDHKRLEDGDGGPNTGGMGAYTPVADATDALMDRVREEILGPTLEALRARGLDYRGLLYAGLMLTPEGPKVLEFNCRFGDPETQVVLPCFSGDLHALLASAAGGALEVEGALERRGAAVGVVHASAGYPASATRGVPIPGLDGLAAADRVFHAATRRSDTGWVTDGGRVLCAVGGDASLAGARTAAYALSDRLLFEGVQRRNDIAAAEVSRDAKETT